MKSTIASLTLILLTQACASAPGGLSTNMNLAAPAPPAITTAAIAPAPSADPATADRVIAAWPERPRLTAARMLAQYGTPEEATSARLVWFNRAPWKRIMVTAEEVLHYFPMLHTDMLYQTINYTVPPGRADEVSALDGSLLVDRTKGELTVRCDREESNLLALNVAHDVVTGRSSVDQGKHVIAMAEMELFQGARPTYTTALQFNVPDTPMPDVEAPVFPGSQRLAKAVVQDPVTLMTAAAPPMTLAAMTSAATPMAGASREATDAEIAAFAATIDMK